MNFTLPVLPSLFSLKAVAAAFAAGAVLSGGVTGCLAHKLRKADQVRVVTRTLVRERKAEDVTAKVAAASEVKQERIRVVTKTLIEKVPVYVTPEVDRSYPVPVGAVRLLNAAAQGVDLSEVPAPAGQPDDAPSSAPLHTVLGTEVDNLGACNVYRQQLTDLQGWIRAQQKLAK